MPAAVPLLRQGSRPEAVVAAAKTKELPTPRRETGLEPAAPGSRSATIVVPAKVPSVAHSSRPAVPSSAAKKTVEPATVRKSGSEESGPAWISRTSWVPASVPSVVQSSRPFASEARKSTWAPKVMLPAGEPLEGPG
ncbi:MAG: hypothetical protein MI919_34915 [Holophagales bacterium]|nr:hypothetical protein [Holophagales bacterium]